MAASVPLAPIPPANIRLTLGPDEWEACLDAWLTLADLQLRLPSNEFAASVTERGSGSSFLTSFYRELATLQPSDETLSNSKARSLQRTGFLLFGRITQGTDSPQDLLTLDFLSNFCHAHRQGAVLEPLFQSCKDRLAKLLESSTPGAAVSELTLLAPILRASPDIGFLFVTGSDFLDALATAYGKLVESAEQLPVVSTAYLGLVSTVNVESANLSLLSDCLYGLKGQADSRNHQSSLLADLVTNTPLLGKLRRTTTGKGADRLGKLLDDLFPDLGSGFVLRLLDEYGDNVEQVTAHLLDDSLAPHLQSLDRSEEAPIHEPTVQEEVDHLAPRSTPPPAPEPFVPERRNVFDDDELLSADAARLHIGKKAEHKESGPTNKAAILSALAAFDADDDERDDTYDVEDVGGTIDVAHPDGEPGPSAKITGEQNELALFNAYKASPELFGRTFDVRRGQARMALKSETGMTDEAIEGWAIMLQRDPRRLKRLDAQYGTFDGRQTALASTAYRENNNTETEDSDGPGQQGSGNRGGFRGRGGGRGSRGRGGGRGRGGSVAGPSNDPNTAAAQRRKEASKSSRANHNRRDQRAKKMARGGLPG
ncbi:hypothetical protein KC332_g16605 [Hortaea werneckii]|nr:hypothetical protein KC358_g1828 [Hortaea werneckii]KAI6849834.1 hypothetical protein KC350_g2426 [Hortaea werneckii]KAI6935966.1 hypothetical protein KC341_g6556 [Hortaea werneckii]KAI6948981.1 hypothetical protein KC348_g1641 [Hortaea werneckii]KAI6969275.1 hypothetical protein KC321_g7981 [Hortaea werneckii]